MSEATKKYPAKHLVALVRQANEIDRKKVDLGQGIKDKISVAVEEANLHRGAFNVVKKLDKMDETKRNDFCAALFAYIEDMYVEGAWKEHVGDLVTMAEDQTDIEDEILQKEQAAALAAKAETSAKDHEALRAKVTAEELAEADEWDEAAPDPIETETTAKVAKAKRGRKPKVKAEEAPRPTGDAYDEERRAGIADAIAQTESQLAERSEFDAAAEETEAAVVKPKPGKVVSIKDGAPVH